MELRKKSKLPVYQTVISEDLADDTGIEAVAFVTDPAIQSSFVALSNQEEKIKYVFSSEEAAPQQLISGPLIIPDQLIYRKEDSGYEYEIFFTKEDIFKIQKKFFAQSRQNNTNFQHKIPFKGAILVECWTKIDQKNDKSIALGLDKSLPEGTLFLTYYIKDKNTWMAMKDGTIPVTGFSLEGLFSDILVNQSSQIKEKEEVKNLASTTSDTNTINKTKLNQNKMKKNSFLVKLLSLLRSVKMEDYNTSDGKVLSVDDNTMMATLDGQPAPDGDYPLEDGTIASILQGMLVNITDPTDSTETPPAPPAPPAPGKKAESDLSATKDKDENTPDLQKQIEELKSQNQTLVQSNLALTESNKTLTEQKEKLSKVAAVTIDLTPEKVIDFTKMSKHEKITYLLKKENNLV